MKYEIDGQEYDVVIEKKNNKNSYIRMKEDLKIYVTTSRWSTKKDVERMLRDNYTSLQKMLHKKIAQIEKEKRFFYLGQCYDIIEVSIMDNIEIEGNRIYTPSMEKLEKWYAKETKKIFMEHYDEQCERFQEDITVPLNSHLMEYSLDKLDYIIIHELSHIIHFDHSKYFWELVSKYCPNYKQIRKELKE